MIYRAMLDNLNEFYELVVPDLLDEAERGTTFSGSIQRTPSGRFRVDLHSYQEPKERP